jgi:LEA14-like dessication related protein
LSLVEIQELSRKKIEALIRLHVHNPLPFGFGVQRIDYELLIHGMPVMKIRDEDGVRIKRAGDSRVSVPITFLPENMQAVMKKSMEASSVNKISGGYRINSAPYEFRIDLFLKFFFIRYRWRTVIRKEAPLFQVPQMQYSGISVNSLKLKGADLCLNLKLFNKNKFAITAQDISYRFSVDHHNWITGTIPGHIHIPSRTQTSFSFPLKVLFKNIRFLSLLRKGSKLRYDLILTLKLDSNNIIFNNSRVIVENTGTVGDLVKFVRNSE